jgi:hypothetical protein
MQILSVRFGLATNSSSTHSFVLLPEGVTAKDYPGYVREGHAVEQEFGDFGWQHFTAATPQAKLRYLAVMLRDRFHEQLPYNIANTLIQSWLGDVTRDDDDGIDHQSFLFIPSEHGTTLPSERFTKDLAKYLLQDRLVILGGNDNIQACHPLDDGSAFRLPMKLDAGLHYSNYVCRYDEEYEFWTIFCTKDGTKIRMRFDAEPNEMKVKPTKASVPELVDLKITNFCPYKCPYCYQDSSEDGVHANQYDVTSLARDLGRFEVFEVAIGGGEPTFHPNFVEILESFKRNGVIANFTTRNLQWLRDPKKAREIIDACGAFGYSAHTGEEVKEVATLLNYNGFPLEKCNIHLVLGTFDQWRFKELLRATNEQGFNATILSYKSVGRGADFQPENYDGWLRIVKEDLASRGWGNTKIGIDTPLAAEYEERLKEMELPDWLYETKEGGFSCYIDATTKMMGPSSYCDPEEMKSIKRQGSWGEEDYKEQAEMIYEVWKTF